MSNIEHLFENCLHSLWNNESEKEWLEQEEKRGNSEGVSKEVLDAIYTSAIYVAYTLMIPRDYYNYNNCVECFLRRAQCELCENDCSDHCQYHWVKAKEDCEKKDTERLLKIIKEKYIDE